MRNTQLTTSLLLLLFCASSNAALINHGNYTTDTESGLDWLKWEVTKNQSYNHVESQFGLGGTYEGWQFATSTQTLSFLNTLGFSNYNTSIFWANNTKESWDNLVSYMGADTDYDPSASYVYGMVQTSAPKATTYAHIANPHSAHQWNHNLLSYKKSDSFEFLGSFLVRSTVSVSEPPTLATFMLGLAAAIRIRRKNYHSEKFIEIK